MLFDPKFKTVVGTDVSEIAIRAVISHKYENGSVKPIAYASRSLFMAETTTAKLRRRR